MTARKAGMTDRQAGMTDRKGVGRRKNVRLLRSRKSEIILEEKAVYNAEVCSGFRHN